MKTAILVLCCLVVMMGSVTLGKDLNEGMHTCAILQIYTNNYRGPKTTTNIFQEKEQFPKSQFFLIVLATEGVNFILFSRHFLTNHATSEYMSHFSYIFCRYDDGYGFETIQKGCLWC